MNQGACHGLVSAIMSSSGNDMSVYIVVAKNLHTMAHMHQNMFGNCDPSPNGELASLGILVCFWRVWALVIFYY